MSIATQTVSEFLDSLASSSPTPGGGAVAGLCGATGVGLLAMVANLTIGKKGYEEASARMEGILAVADEERVAFLELADRDAAAFDAVMAAFRMPKETDEQKAERSAAIQRASVEAAEVPLAIARKALAVMELAPEAGAIGNANAASDAASAAQLLSAAAGCAIYNVEINAATIKDEATAERLRNECTTLRERASELLTQADTAFSARLAG